MAYLETKGNAFYARFRVDGRKKKKYLGCISLEEAKIIIADLTVQEKAKRKGFQVNGNFGISLTETPGPKFKDYAPKYLEWYGLKFPRSINKVCVSFVRLVEHFGELEISDNKNVRRQWLAAWSAYETTWLKVFSGNTIQCDWASLRACLKRAANKDGLCEASPLSTAKFDTGILSEPHRYVFTKENLISIYEADPKFNAVWQFVANTGLRRGELVLLPRNRVGSDEVEVIHDPEAGLSTKTNRSRIVPLSDNAQAARERILFDYRDGETFFEPFYKSTWSKYFREARNAAGIDRGHLHSLRHTFISYLVNDQKESLPVVMELAGHSKIETTMKYIHTTPEHHRDAISRLDL